MFFLVTWSHKSFWWPDLLWQMSISIDTFPKSLEMHWGVFVNKIKTKVICNWTPTFRMKDMQLTDKPRKRLKTLPRFVRNLLDWKLLLGDAVQPVVLQLLISAGQGLLHLVHLRTARRWCCSTWHTQQFDWDPPSPASGIFSWQLMAQEIPLVW